VKHAKCLFALLPVVLLLSGCPKQQEPELAAAQEPEAGTTDQGSQDANPEIPAGDTSSSNAEASAGSAPGGDAPTTTLPDGTVVELAVDSDGRVQQVDAMGYPMFDVAGEVIWRPTNQEIVAQLFEEAVMLRKGVAGGPPNLISAASKLQEVLALAPDFHSARYNLGLVWLQMSFYEDAQKVLREVLEQQPDLTGARLALGITYERTGDLRNAEIAYQRGLQQAPKDAGLLNGQARVWLKNGRYIDAEEGAKAILKVDSNSIDAFNTLGLAYLEMKQLERARFAFMKAQSLPGGDASASVVTNLGLVKMRMGKEFEAREHFEEALRLDSFAPSAKVNLGHLMLKNLDYEGARTLLEEATRALPGNIPVKLNLAVALRGTGEVDRAQTLYEEIAADPDTEYQADAILNLGILQGDFLRDYGSAIKSYEEYIALRESGGEGVAEDDAVHAYLKEMRKLKKRQDRKREKAARKAREAAEKETTPAPQEDP